MWRAFMGAEGDSIAVVRAAVRLAILTTHLTDPPGSHGVPSGKWDSTAHVLVIKNDDTPGLVGRLGTLAPTIRAERSFRRASPFRAAGPTRSVSSPLDWQTREGGRGRLPAGSDGPERAARRTLGSSHR